MCCYRTLQYRPVVLVATCKLDTIANSMETWKVVDNLSNRLIAMHITILCTMFNSQLQTCYLHICFKFALLSG